ncbi:MAG: cytochrome o ubiquinol oxidase subunit IV [Candidatus Doudnabacteria bacterium]|nr:cytochrome o ubiquinol oxidase subunit IV [Candidatus Doudnabacteria bacterium]
MRNYIYGFILSILLTLTAYFIVVEHLLQGRVLVFTILALAIIQLWVQAIFFLHLDQESGPRWNLSMFLGTLLLILVVVGGSLWIMNHLNYNMMPSDSDLMHGENIYK